MGTWTQEREARLVRQAHSYLAGAVSSTVLIASAVLAFVLLVSVQAFRDWPVSGLGLGGGDRDVSVSSGQAASVGPALRPTHARAVGKAGAAASGHVFADGGASVPGRSGSIAQRNGLGGGSPGTATPRGATSPGESGSSSVGDSPPTGSAPGPASGGGPGSPGTGAGGGSAGSSPSAGVTGAVDNTVSKVDETVGGALGETGVTKLTEGVVNRVAGPQSAVGHEVDEAVSTVGGLLHLHR